MNEQCAMAEDVTLVDTYPKKNAKIIVNVDEVLPDILVVSFTFEGKLFQGVLLDSTKKNLPCGIIAPPHLTPPLGTATQLEEAEDKLYSASQRFSYFQEKPAQSVDIMANSRFQLKRNIRPPARFKNARMTVRLRPRQVLCSKCRGICNENSENVDLSNKKRKGADCPPSDAPSAKVTRGDRRLRSSGEISPRPIFPDNLREQPKKNSNNPSEYSENKNKKLCPSLIPKLSRLQPREISNAMNGKVKIKLVGNYWTRGEAEGQCDGAPMYADNKSFQGDLCDEADPLCITNEANEQSTEDETDGKLVDEPKFAMMDCSAEAETYSNELDKKLSPVCPVCPIVDVKPVDSMDVDACEEQDPLCTEDPLAILHDDEADTCDVESSSSGKRVLRKKRSVGSMEDLWDETVFEDSAAKKSNLKSRTTPVIKISFGSTTGEGTVLKIPAKVQSYIPSESETEEKKKERTKRDASAKAAKKALKKAKKEARRKILGNASPVRSLGGMSPRYPNVSNVSPRYALGCSSPRYGLGSGSPRHLLVGNSSPAYEVFPTRRHKHKVKHKKRHKEERKHKDLEQGGQASQEDDSIREQCLKQKLSISLKRLNATAYMRCDSSSSPTNSDASDDHSDAVPDFPGNPLMMRISTQTINSCQTMDGRLMTVGDVVWGKIHGFPWWPGKVLSITVSRKDDGASLSPQAHVAWYGSSTSSLMSCDQLNPFLETFQMRYNKKKRGPYKEAIKQATNEAKRGELCTVEPGLPSPSEVDVLS